MTNPATLLDRIARKYAVLLIKNKSLQAPTEKFTIRVYTFPTKQDQNNFYLEVRDVKGVFNAIRGQNHSISIYWD